MAVNRARILFGSNPFIMVKVGINGFGRIGRLSFRGAWDMPELEIVGSCASCRVKTNPAFLTACGTIS
jgi:glyceraldehyde-3-phosphate dehydrogenase/erythrose-4-phosphate dehydrogenase